MNHAESGTLYFLSPQSENEYFCVIIVRHWLDFADFTGKPDTTACRELSAQTQEPQVVTHTLRMEIGYILDLLCSTLMTVMDGRLLPMPPSHTRDQPQGLLPIPQKQPCRVLQRSSVLDSCQVEKDDTNNQWRMCSEQPSNIAHQTTLHIARSARKSPRTGRSETTTAVTCWKSSRATSRLQSNSVCLSVKPDKYLADTRPLHDIWQRGLPEPAFLSEYNVLH